MWEQVIKAARKESELEEVIKDFDVQQFEMNEDIKDARKATKAVKKMLQRFKIIAEARKEERDNAKARADELQDEAARLSKINDAQAEELEYYKSLLKESEDKKKIMKKEWVMAAGGKGGTKRWPVWVVQLVCELLVNGTTPSAIPKNLVSMYTTLYGEKPKEWPCDNYVRGCRVIVQVIAETIAAFKIASADKYAQLWTDATSRRQISFQAMIVGIMGEGNKIDPVVLSSCIFSEDETAEKQAESIIDEVSASPQLFIRTFLLTNVCVVSQFKSLQSRLARLREVVSELCPDKLNQVPTEEGVDIKKLGDGGLVTSDTCNVAQAVRRIIVAECIGALEMDCMHHLRNVWFGNMEKDLTKELNTLLRVSLDEIDPKLRVTSSMSAIIRAIEKEFGLCANYVKGHGALFAQWMYETHPGASLLHVLLVQGKTYVPKDPSLYS